jgi:hypothetical protein
LSPLGRRLLRAVSANVAQTAPDDPDSRLRGRTYAVPFEEVWLAAHGLATRRRRMWRITLADDHDGIIRVETRSLVFRFIADLEIRISLDQDAQTRVDVHSASRKGFADLGVNARRIGRFLRKLDKTLARNRKKRGAASPSA